MGRPFDKHIDNEELNALVPSSSETEECLDFPRTTFARLSAMWRHGELQQEVMEIPATRERILERGGSGSGTAGR